MSESDLLFMEKFETKVRQKGILESIKPNLTQEGVKALERLDKFINDNLMKYLDLSN